MTTYYVRKTGNDTTGTGATALPWLTIAKALTVAVAGDTILIGDGTYAENNTGGTLTIGTAYASTLTISSESGDKRAVIISGSTSSVNLTGSNITFHGVTFRNVLNTVNGAVVFGGSTASNIRLLGCVLQVQSNSAQVNYGIRTSWTTASSVFAGIEVSNCEIEQFGPFRVLGIYMGWSGVGTTASRFVFSGNKITTAGYAIRLEGITDVEVTNNDCNSFGLGGSDHCFSLGIDNTTGETCSGVVAGNRFRDPDGHCALIGAGCDGVTFVGNTVIGGTSTSLGSALIVKQATNIVLLRNTIISGGNSGLYFKAATDCQAYDNDIRCNYSTAMALRVGRDTANSDTCSNLTIRRNRFHVTSGQAINIGPDIDDSGGSIVDENVYVVAGSGSLGSVRSNTVTTLSGLRAAWATYNRPNNDANSRIGAKHAPFGGAPLVTLPA